MYASSLGDVARQVKQQNRKTPAFAGAGVDGPPKAGHDGLCLRLNLRAGRLPPTAPNNPSRT